MIRTSTVPRGAHASASSNPLAPHGGINVGESERWFSVLGGAALTGWGLSRGRLDGLLLAAIGGGLVYRGLTGHCSMYEALGVSTECHKSNTSIPAGQGVKFDEKITIRRSAEEVYRFWRNLENLPRFMSHLVSVHDLGGGKSHWVAKGPVGNVEWDAVIINERQDELIAWRSLDGSSVQNSGSVHFTAAENGGTEVNVVLRYNPPAGKVGATLAWLIGQDPEQQVREDLRNLKRILEAGVVGARA